MKTQKQNTNLTKKQRLKNRTKQVRIQKLILASVCILLLGIAVLRPVYNHKQKNYTINSTCEGYRSKVETEAANYDMSDYVDLILALMMQESSEAFAKIASGETARSEENPLYTTAGPWDYGDQHYPEHVLRYYHI